MRNYIELVERLRANTYTVEELSIILPQAADAIEELSEDNAALNGVVTNLLEQLADFGKTFKWISVGERLPKVDQPVMICAFGKSVGEGVYRGHDGFHHVWKMYASSGTYWDGEVTHYVPLPSRRRRMTNDKIV